MVRLSLQPNREQRLAAVEERHAAEPITSDRYQDLTEHGSAAFKPPVLPLASFELTIMAKTVDKLVKREITPARADAVLTALRGI